MPASDRGGSSKTRLIIGAAIAAVLIIVTLIGVGLFNQAGYQQEAADNAGQYARYADQKVAESCGRVAAVQLAQCLAEARIESELEKRQYEHDQADLIAQRKAALWTSLMGIAALIGMGLSVVGVVLVYTTFRETKRTADEAKRSADSFIDAERPHLRVHPHGAFPDRDGNPQRMVMLMIENFGQSPAILERIEWSGLTDREFPGSCLAGRNLGFSVRPTDETTALPKSLNVANDFGYVGGCITYRSRFRPDHVAYFLFKMPEGDSIKLKAIPKEKRQGWPDDT